MLGQGPIAAAVERWFAVSPATRDDAKGSGITETASDADMVKLIKAHGREISGFVTEGMPAMMRDMMR